MHALAGKFRLTAKAKLCLSPRDTLLGGRRGGRAGGLRASLSRRPRLLGRRRPRPAARRYPGRRTRERPLQVPCARATVRSRLRIPPAGTPAELPGCSIEWHRCWHPRSSGRREASRKTCPLHAVTCRRPAAGVRFRTRKQGRGDAGTTLFDYPRSI